MQKLIFFAGHLYSGDYAGNVKVGYLNFGTVFVFNNWSLFLLAMDPRFEGGARLAGTRVPGQIHGGGRGKVRRKKYLPQLFFVSLIIIIIILKK